MGRRPGHTQVAVWLPGHLAEELRERSHDWRRSQNDIVVEATRLYLAALSNLKSREAPMENRGGS
ncbi:MAG: hypothetical protein ACYCV4_02590 [Dermatophilaceae bacterium]